MDNSPEQLDFSLLPDVSDLDPDAEDELFLANMRARENALHYIFGETDPKDTVLSPKDPDLLFNWLGGAIMSFPPQGNRNNWYFVTHGLSQPIEEDDLLPVALADYLDYRAVNDEEVPISGWGIELVISTRDSCDWPPDLLCKAVKYLLFNEEAQIILPGHRIPSSGPIAGTDSLINWVLAITSPEYPSTIRLPGGMCTLIHLIGVTESEIKRAQELGGREGSLVLQRVLQQLGVGCLTDPERSCLTTHPQFEEAWREAERSL